MTEIKKEEQIKRAIWELKQSARSIRMDIEYRVGNLEAYIKHLEKLLDPTAEKPGTPSISFRASKDGDFIRGVAFEERGENVVKFGFRITPYFGLQVEKNRLGVKVFDAFNEIFSKYKVKPDFGREPATGACLGLKTFGAEWRVANEDRDKVIQEIKKLVDDVNYDQGNFK